jgi:hypothetical protein
LDDNLIPRQYSCHLQDATARHWIKLRPPGLGVRLSSAAFLDGIIFFEPFPGVRCGRHGFRPVA